MPCTIRLKGRLGNQIMQIGALLAYSFKNGIDYIIPEHTMNDNVWPPYFYNLHYPHKHSGNVISITEETHAYKTIPFEENWAGHLIELDGYYQSYKYFDIYKDKISEILGFDKLNGYIKNVHVHVRRGDYLLYPDKHPVVNMTYLEEAINQFNDGAYIFQIFSDDMKWCKRNLTQEFFDGFGKGHEVFFVNPYESIVRELHVYSVAKYNIISNSTWGYCGAYFGSNTGKVVTPHEDNWFGPGNKHLDVKDLLPPDWIRIKY